MFDLVDEIVAGYCHDIRHSGRLECNVGDLFYHGLGAPDGGRVGQLHQRQKIALILFGHKSAGYGTEQENGQNAHARKNSQYHVPQLCHPLDTGRVTGSQFIKALVEGPENSVGFAGSRPQQNRAQRRA